MIQQQISISACLSPNHGGSHQKHENLGPCVLVPGRHSKARIHLICNSVSLLPASDENWVMKIEEDICVEYMRSPHGHLGPKMVSSMRSHRTMYVVHVGEFGRHPTQSIIYYRQGICSPSTSSRLMTVVSETIAAAQIGLNM